MIDILLLSTLAYSIVSVGLIFTLIIAEVDIVKYFLTKEAEFNVFELILVGWFFPIVILFRLSKAVDRLSDRVCKGNLYKKITSPVWRYGGKRD